MVTTTSCVAASRWLSPASAPVRLQNAASFSGVRQYATTRSIDGERCAHARDLGLGLVAAADHAERAGTGLREVPRRDAARGAGAKLPEPIRLDDRDERGRLRVEEADDEGRAVRRRRVQLPARKAEPVIRRRHVRERALREPEPAARSDLDLAGRHPPEAGLDRVDGDAGAQRERRRRTR